MKSSKSILICSSIASAFAFNTRDEFDPANYASDDIITRDVAIIGGGATGTYAAINLQLAGKSVALVEKQDRLGGHTHTYIDPITNISVDYGVQAFWNSVFPNLAFFPMNLLFQRHGTWSHYH